MGQARTRGSRDARIADAQQQVEAMKPGRITCNRCQAALTAVRTLDTRRMKGIALAFAAHCAACDQDTWALRGEPQAVADFFTALEHRTGQEVELGSARPGPQD